MSVTCLNCDKDYEGEVNFDTLGDNFTCPYYGFEMKLCYDEWYDGVSGEWWESFYFQDAAQDWE